MKKKEQIQWLLSKLEFTRDMPEYDQDDAHRLRHIADRHIKEFHILTHNEHKAPKTS